MEFGEFVDREIERVLHWKEYFAQVPSDLFILALLIIAILVLIAAIQYFHSYWATSILVVLSYIVFEKMSKIFKKARLYQKNRDIISSPNNLTKYTNELSHYFREDLKPYVVFKKCDFDFNRYYWDVKTGDRLLYYTDSDDRPGTLEAILKKTKISEFRKKIVDDFFEYCLVSYVANEDLGVLRELSKGKKVPVSGLEFMTQDFFTLGKKEPEDDEEEGKGTKTPDLKIESGEQSWIIDAYNGASLKAIKAKLTKYSQDTPEAKVFVFSSSIEKMEQLNLSQPPRFKLFGRGQDGNPEEVPVITIGSLDISIDELNEKYFKPYKIFYSEIFYWQSCEAEGEIIRSQSASDQIAK